jgi:adenylate kinase family enzyme
VIRRILIKGACGAGKSTLGARLASRLELPWIELDSLHHGPNWAAASPAELRARVLARLDDERGWVVDGNYDSKLGTLLLDRAELIVWLDLPLRTKLLRLVHRTAGRVFRQEELWNGNRETLRGAFWGSDALFPWAVRTHFRHRRLWPQTLANRTFVRLRSAGEVDAWFSEFCSS